MLPSLSEWRPIIKFGSQTTLAAVMWTAAVDLSDLIVGKALGFSPLAMLSRAQGLMNLFNREVMSAVRGVLYPAFARAFRAREPVDALYITGVANVTVFAWPFYGIVALYPLEILRLLFGPQWDSAASLVPVFCLAGAVAATYNLIPAWMTAIGRIDLLTVVECTIQPLRVLAVAIAALHFRTLLACAVAFLIATAMAAPFFYFAKSRCAEMQYGKLMAMMWRSGKVTMISLSIPTAIAIYVGLGRTAPVSIVVPFVASTVGAALWIAGTMWFAHPITSTPIYRKAIGRFVSRSR
jgi:O-antigen/teichoic acid export membrane protein